MKFNGNDLVASYDYDDIEGDALNNDGINKLTIITQLVLSIMEELEHFSSDTFGETTNVTSTGPLKRW